MLREAGNEETNTLGLGKPWPFLMKLSTSREPLRTRPKKLEQTGPVHLTRLFDLCRPSGLPFLQIRSEGVLSYDLSVLAMAASGILS